MPQSCGDLGHIFQCVERDSLDAALHRSLVQALTGKVEAGGTGRILRQDERAVVVLGEALKARRGIHGVADGCDDLRAWRAQRADDSLAEMNADANAQRLFQIGLELRIEPIEAR